MHRYRPQEALLSAVEDAGFEGRALGAEGDAATLLLAVQGMVGAAQQLPLKARQV